MYDYLDDRQTKRLKELVPYEVLAPDADEIIEELERLNKLLDETRLSELHKEYIINELEKYIHNELVLDFYNDDMPCELIINKMEKMIKELKEND